MVKRYYQLFRISFVSLLVGLSLALTGCSSNSEDGLREEPIVKITPTPEESIETPPDGGGEIDFAALRGMRLEDATSFVEREGFVLRVVKIDGESMIVTEDYRMDRVNVEIENEIVVAAEIG
jgi:hypothetical protein